ncbi:uncharacterized protein LOC123532100 [Mercenaria mercenaria]|uniref:uncharacterized protein LOC123532100 n=1 Tax=Mercenaria mercenaria TaxID=6596 RepID=UPI00234F7C99|nr:uncharacterized protein LOC123532100 [Mercenaria mercenaria]
MLIVYIDMIDLHTSYVCRIYPCTITEIPLSFYIALPRVYQCNRLVLTLQHQTMAFEYRSNHSSRGTALIIGNEFKGQKAERKGCKEDVIMMQELFRRLDFNVTTFMNLSAAQMKEKLTQASKNKNNEDSDCFVFVLSTHGHEVFVEDMGQVYPSGADVWRHGVLGEDGTTVYVDDIIDIFTDDKTYKLAGKPKLFFLQACKSRQTTRYSPQPGDTYDPGHKVEVMTTAGESSNKGQRSSKADTKDSVDWLYNFDITGTEDIYSGWVKDPDVWCPETMAKTPGSQASQQDAAWELVEEDAGGSGDSNSLPPSPFDIVPIKCPDDFLIMYPVMSGKFAFRNARAGSHLLNFLHKSENLAELLRGCNLLQYLTRVSQGMALYEYKPDLNAISVMNGRRAMQARISGVSYDPLGTFKNHLYCNIKYLSKEENQEMLIEIIGEEHRNRLKGDASIVEPYLKDMVEKLTEAQMTRILDRILPFKMTACVVHRLKGDVCFLPKRKNTPMGKLRNALLPKETYV